MLGISQKTEPVYQLKSIFFMTLYCLKKWRDESAIYMEILMGVSRMVVNLLIEFLIQVL